MLAHRRVGRRTAALAAALALPLAACTEAQEKLYLSSTTVLGIDASVNTTRQSGRVQIGYDRYFVTWVPQGVQADRGTEIMAALNCTKVVVGSLALRRFDESLATGEAAKKFAKQLSESAPSSDYFDCFKPKSAEATR
jgi:hypothetical protein